MSFLDVCRFNPTAGGTTDWTVSSLVQGYQTPASAGAVNGASYRYRAESSDLSQWEVGFGTFNTGTGVLTRATVLFNSSGTTSKINFSAAPQVAIVGLAEDANEFNGAGIFTFVSATQVKFAPFNGARIKIQGSWFDIPASGITIANTGLAASTLFYAYAFLSSGVLTLELSTTSHVTSTTAGNVGTEVKIGDESRSLVGVVFTNGNTPGQFADSATARNVRSWFNRSAAQIRSSQLGTNTGIVSSTMTEVSANLRVEFTLWADEVITVLGQIGTFNNTPGAIVRLQYSLDGTVTGLSWDFNGDGAGGVRNTPLIETLTTTEGHHILSLFASLNLGTASVYVSSWLNALIR